MLDSGGERNGSAGGENKMQGKQNTTKKALNECQAVTERECSKSQGRPQGLEGGYW